MLEKFKQKFKHIYETKYKLLLLIPILMVVFAALQIGVQYAQTGEFVHKGISLKGGSTITITNIEGVDYNNLEQQLTEEFPQNEITLRTLTSAGKVTAVALDSSLQNKEEIDALVQSLETKTGLTAQDYSVEIIGSSLGNAFFSQMVKALLVAFLLMSIVVLIYFRNFIPSVAVIAAAFSDILVTLAIFNLTGLKLNTAGVAAFLMLIGFSVDTDMVLSTRVLKRTEGTIMERVYSATNTGMTMIFTMLVAILTTLIFVQSDVIKQIMIILLIGTLVDFIMTWIQNVGILRLYLERKSHKK
jgi:preprotein translocase subunit SecF